MSLSKKHYEDIAHVLDANFASYPIVADMADMLEEDNPRFDRQRFIEAATGQLRENAVRELRMLDCATGKIPLRS